MRLSSISFLCVSLWSCGSPLSNENYADCGTDGGKKDITEVADVEELEAIEKESPSSTCERLRYDDDARLYLDAAANSRDASTAKEQYSNAAAIYARLVEFYPEDYDRYGRLAAAYAGAGGVEMASFLKAMASSSNGIFEMGKETLPSPEDSSYEDDKSNLQQAVIWIDEKVAREALPEVPTADNLQMTVYRMAETLVIANGFLVMNDDGTWDESAIEDLSADDVDSIVNNLDSIASQIPDPEARAKLEAFANSDELTEDEKKELLRNALAQ